MAIAVLGYTGNSSGGGGSTPVGATLMKTGQTTSYRTGDDGDIEAGRDDSFFLLDSTLDTNPFGNYQRFTGTTGGYYDQTLSGYYDKDGVGTSSALAFPDNILIDWSTYNGSTVLGYDITKRGTDTFDDAVDNALALSIGTYTSGWRLANMIELDNLRNYELFRVFQWLPFGDTGNDTFWSSNTSYSATRAYWRKNQLYGFPTEGLKTTVLYWHAVRTFTVTGTTLT